MSISFDSATTSSFVNPGTSVTYSHTCSGINRILFVLVTGSSSTTTFSATYDGVSMTQIGSIVSSAEGVKRALFYLIAPNSGAHNIVATANGAAYMDSLAHSYTGAKQSGQPDVSSSGTGTVSSSPWQFTATVIPNADKSWSVMFGRDTAEGNLNAVSGCVERSGGGIDQGFDTGNATLSGQQVNMTVVSTGARTFSYSYIIASFAPAYTGIPDGLIGKLSSYWKFDESSGNASDSVGVNTLTNTNTVTYETGKINNGALTNPTGTKYFTKTSPTGLPSGATSHTINFWAKPRVTQSGSVPGVIAWGAEATNQMAGLGFSNTGLYYLGYTNDASVTYSYATGTWSMYTVTVDASTKKVNFYVNGALVGTEQTLANTPNIGTSFVVVGAQRPGNLVIFDGNIDEVGIWGRILDICEIKALYNSGSGVQYNFSTLPSNIPYIGNSLIDHDQGSGTVSYYNNGDLLVVSVNSTSNDVSAMTYNGASMTQLGTAQYFSTYARYHSTWYLVNPSVGTYNIVTTGGANWQFDIFSAYNVDQTTPITGATTTNTSGANAYIDVTTTVNNAYAIGVGQIAAVSTAGTDTTMLVNGTPGNFYTLRSTNPVATAGTFRVQSAHAGSVGYFLRGFGINPVATISTNSGFFALM
jgi:hypothetical protein